MNIPLLSKLESNLTTTRSEMSFRLNRVKCRQFTSERIEVLLRTIFPADSNEQIAVRASNWLGCNPRSVRSWLDHSTIPGTDVFFGLNCKIRTNQAAEIATAGLPIEDIQKMFRSA